MIKQITGKKTKADLHLAVKELLQTGTVGTHEEIRTALKKQGFIVNQVRISRLLHKIGAIKMVEGEQTVYRLPSETITVKPDDSLKHLIFNVTHNETLIVIQTAPGSAQLVANLLDQGRGLGILGTVAGDNTILVVPEKTHQIQTTFKKIHHLLLGQ